MGIDYAGRWGLLARLDSIHVDSDAATSSPRAMQRLTGRVSKGNCARTVATRLLSRRHELRWSRALALEDVHPAGPRGTTRGANHDLRAGYCNTDSEGITGNRVGALAARLAGANLWQAE